MFFLDVFSISMGIVIFVSIYSIFTKNQRFNRETGLPVILLRSGIVLATMLKDELDSHGLECYTSDDSVRNNVKG